MGFLLLRIVFNVTFSHLLRLSQARTPRPMAAAAINYLVAALACGAWAWMAGTAPHPAAVALGGAAGLTYVTSLVMMLPAMRRSGVAVTGAVVQLSLMLPVVVAAWRFGEVPNGYQAAGIGLTLVALPLLSAATSVEGDARPGGVSLLTVLLFFSTGTSQVVMKEFAATRPGSELALYSASLFAAATLLTYAWMLGSGDTGRANGDAVSPDEGHVVGEWPIGIALGTVNVLQLVCLLEALRALPAVVVFPASAALGVTVNAVVSMLLWGERPRAAAWVGIALSAGAVLLLNLK
jgi:drug/metabolite transporter (DMT)-like permease